MNFLTNLLNLNIGTKIGIFIAICVINTVLIFFASLKFFLVLQLEGYDSKKYFSWLKQKDNKYLSRLMLLSLMGILFFLVLSFCFLGIANSEVLAYIGLFAYLFFILVYINTEKNVNSKVPLKITKRLVRLFLTYSILTFILTFVLLIIGDAISFSIGTQMAVIFKCVFVCLTPLLIPLIVALSNYINMPFENVIKKRYIKLATKKLDTTNVIKIGITGSFGKTTTKEILKSILSIKYKVLATPNSFNTPMGISITTKNLDSTYDIFIAEMGARKIGDIKELTEMVKPSIAVITGVNNQHLETFGNIENTIKAKSEILDGVKNGKAFFSCDNENAIKMFNNFNGEKYLAGLNYESDNLVTATDIKATSSGTSFNLNFKGGKIVKCSTSLLGLYSIKNICLASAVAYKMGITENEIATGINRLTSVKHRLELVENNKGITIIDDSYNANVDGINACMEVLALFTGRKIVITPGLVELGNEEYNVNFDFGKTLSKNADIVIVVGNHNKTSISTGLLDGGFNEENIIFAKDLERANVELDKIMKKNDIVLFENDLPDNYS